MIPKEFITIDNIPVTANGKTDLRALERMAAENTSGG